MKKPELLVTAGTLDEVHRFIQSGADAVNIGEQKYGLRLPGEFSLTMIADAVKYAHSNHARIYVSVNTIMHNEHIEGLAKYLEELNNIGVDAIIFGDPAVLIACKQAGIQVALHWNPETIATNYVTANYWASKGATRMIAARELNLEQVIVLKQNLNMELQVQVHGLTCIYHSKRNLVTNYREHQGHADDNETLGIKRGMYLIEQERQDENYPIYQDLNGTHIFSGDDICMLENLHELLDAGIDSLKIEGLLKTTEYNEVVVRSYRKVIDEYCDDPEEYEFLPEWLEPIEELQDSSRPLSYGFFYKEQVY